MNLETIIRQAKPSYVQSDTQKVTSSIFRKLEQSQSQRPSSNSAPVSKNWVWRKKAVSVAAVLGLVCIGTGSVAFADGVNFLNVIVRFAHNITNGGGVGTDYSLEHTAVNLSNIEKPTPAESEHTAVERYSTGDVTTLTTTQFMSGGGLFTPSYNNTLENYIGMKAFPKLNVDSIVVKDISAYTLNRHKQIFYMFVEGYVPHTKDQPMYLGLYHKTGGTVVIDGQTLANIKQQIKVSAIDATYIEFTNNQSFINYVTWKSGDWIFVLRSRDVPKQTLIKYANDIEKQVHAN